MSLATILRRNRWKNRLTTRFHQIQAQQQHQIHLLSLNLPPLSLSYLLSLFHQLPLRLELEHLLPHPLQNAAQELEEL